MPKGDCFSKAWEVAFEAAKVGDDLLICHGYPTGKGGNAEGQVYAHAWNERVQTFDVPIGDTETRSVTVVTAIDRSNGLEGVELPRDMYYSMGNMTDISRYTVEEAAEIMTRRGHYGPWHGKDAVE